MTPTTIAFIAVVVLIPQLLAFALLRLRGRWWPRVASVIGAFASTCAIVLGIARFNLGRPFEEAGSPEYGPVVALAAALIGVLNVGFALLFPRPE